MNGQEDQSKHQARTESASTASVVELLTSILDQVKCQQIQARAIAQLEGDAAAAVEIFQEIDAALSLTRVGIGGDTGTNSQASVRRGRGRRNVS